MEIEREPITPDALPSFIATAGLYDRAPITDAALWQLCTPWGLDLYCVKCEDRSHFKFRGGGAPSMAEVAARGGNKDLVKLLNPNGGPAFNVLPWLLVLRNSGPREMRAECVRSEKHAFHVHVLVDDATIQKIGQFPSVADIERPELARFDRVSREDTAELRRAVGLAAHGIGVGSYVYLRRVFERRLVAAARERAAADSAFNLEQWGSLHVDEKIDALRDRLPRPLVENAKPLYSVLSKGIHELSEDECKHAFPAVLAVVELIFDELLRAKEREEQERAAVTALNQIHATMKAKAKT